MPIKKLELTHDSRIAATECINLMGILVDEDLGGGTAQALALAKLVAGRLRALLEGKGHAHNMDDAELKKWYEVAEKLR